MIKAKKCFFWGAPAAFLLGTFLLVLFGLMFRPDCFVYDSGYYWELAHQFTDEYGHLTLMAYPESFRGYVFPGFLFLSRVMSRWIGLADETGFAVWAAFFISFVITIVLPYLLSWQENSPFDFLKRLVPLAMIPIFWRGLMLYQISTRWVLHSLHARCSSGSMGSGIPGGRESLRLQRWVPSFMRPIIPERFICSLWSCL